MSTLRERTAFHESRAQHDTGPKSFHDLVRWPAAIMSDAGDQVCDAFCRVSNGRGRGLHLYTQFSGLGGPEIGIDLLCQALRESGRRAEVRMVECSDIKPLARKVLMGFEGVRHGHVFGDVFERVPPAVRHRLSILTPSAEMGPADREKCVSCIKEILQKSPRECFYDGTHCWCYLHDCLCPLYDSSSSPLRPGDVAGAAESVAGPAPKRLRTDARSPLTVMWAGTPCIDFSSMGLCAGATGPQSTALLIWIFEIRRRQWTIVFHECTQHFDVGILDCLLSDLYKVESILVGPEDFGWWCDRPRRMTVMTLKKVGRCISGLEGFRQTFFRPRPDDDATECGNMFFNAPGSDIRKMLAEMNPTDAELFGSHNLTCAHCLGGGNFQRMRQYADARKSEMMTSSLDLLREFSVDMNDWRNRNHLEALVDQRLKKEPCLAVISNTYGQRGSRMSRVFPTLTQSSLVWSFQHDRVNCGVEALYYQGIFVGADALSLPFRTAIDTVSKTLKNSELRPLAGNAINACVAAALTLYVVGHFRFHEEEGLIEVVPAPAPFDDARADSSGGQRRDERAWERWGS